MVKEYVQTILTMAPGMAKKIAKTLSRIDPQIEGDLSRIARQAPTTLCLRTLDILSVLVEPGKPPRILFHLLGDSDPKIRSKVAAVIGRSSNNVLFFKRFLSDGDDRVRANAIEAMLDFDRVVAEGVLMPYLNDKNQRVRANAAKVMYAYGHRGGLETLMEMMDSSDLMMRVSSVWAIGEVREIIAIDRLQALANEETAKGFPFPIDSKFEVDLNREVISRELYQGMKDRAIPISPNARLSTEQQSSRWVILDQDSQQNYPIRKEDDHLCIYNSVLDHSLRAIRKCNALADHLESQVAEFANVLDALEVADRKIIDAILETLNKLPYQSRATLAQTVQSFSIPPAAKSQMNRWLNRQSDKSMLLIALIAFWERPETRKDGDALLVSTRFYDYLLTCLNTLKSEQVDGKAPVLMQLANACKLIGI